MFNDNNIIVDQFGHMLRSSVTQLSSLKPSEWVEKNVVMGEPFPGAFKYSKTPYTREWIDNMAPDHPMKWQAIKKGAQLGASAGFIIPALLWTISEDPCNTYFTVGAPDLISKAVEKLDLGIDRANIRSLIVPPTKRNRSQVSGDTNDKKDFIGGYIYIGSANNYKNWRDVSLRKGMFDDFEAVKRESKEAGSTRKMIEQRFAAYELTHKINYISTPERLAGSNIEEVYLLGDQRKYLVPCEVCHEHIEILWQQENGSGIHFERDNHGRLIESSVGYVCQVCAGFFKDNHKHSMLNEGFWRATTEPSRMGFYSYHVSSLYAPAGMYDWKHYCHDFVEANPMGLPRKEGLYKTFVNLGLGECYEPPVDMVDAKQLQGNIRKYPIGFIPEQQSIADGNGVIVLITCGADLNGKMKGDKGATEDDVRLDYEVLAHAENGATYSILHGSIGTFVSREGSAHHSERQKWTAELGKGHCVWDEFDRVISQRFDNDNGGLEHIWITGVDTGHYNTLVYAYLDHTEYNVVGLRGEKEDRFQRRDTNTKNFRISTNRKNEWYLQVGFIKDDLAEHMKLKWDEVIHEQQPPNFMNYPEPANGLYGLKNYFEHYESEQRVVNLDDNTSRWEKKNTGVQNHMWDCRVYNLVLRDIEVFILEKQLKKEKKIPKDAVFMWVDYAYLFVNS